MGVVEVACKPEFIGIDIFCTDEGFRTPLKVPFSDQGQAEEWLLTHPSDDLSAVRLLTLKLPEEGFDARKWRSPWSTKIIDHACWNPDVYHNLAQSPAGGCAALMDEPWRFILQTPSDGSTFCSMALSRHGNRVKGVYAYTDEDMDPSRLIEGQKIFSGWRGSGQQIFSVPQAVLTGYSSRIAELLDECESSVQRVEDALVEDRREVELGRVGKALHMSKITHTLLERRTNFGALVIDSLTAIRVKLGQVSAGWDSLDACKNSLAARKFDMEALPGRIESARTAINDLILQRTQQQGLEIAQASHMIAEATMKDSASMKTIAVLTMLFLPGTAVASFFSMTMFDWQAQDGESIASWYL